MKKLFQKDEVWFAVLWIIIYVIGFANADAISDSIGTPKLLTVPFGFLLSVILYRFIQQNSLQAHFGLCPVQGSYDRFGYFLPLILISSVNFWNGIALNRGIGEAVLYIVSMCLVGFLEEVIFRGFLFKGMCQTNVTSAIIVSSLTFGVGHIINLLLGAPLFDTLLQLVYASAIGFCYTAVFYASGSILPCILSHAVVNSTSIFAIEADHAFSMATTVVQTILGVGYGLWLLRRHQKISK